MSKKQFLTYPKAAKLATLPSLLYVNMCILDVHYYPSVYTKNQGPHSFSLFELKTFLKTFSTTLTTYCKKIAIFLRRLKDSLMFIMQAI